MKTITSKAVIALLAISVIVSVIGCQRSGQTRMPPAELESVILSEPRTLQPFTLVDHDGKPLTNEQLKGHWTMLFFGYTHCPDICPTTLAVLKGVAQKLDSDPALAASTRVVFVSVDPKRDTPEQLKQYITYFNPAFVAATGSRNEIDNLTSQVGAVYMFDGDTSSDGYIVNHSATILLIDPQGRFYARFNAPHTAGGIADSYRRVRNFHDQ